MPIGVYEGIDEKEIHASRFTKSGEQYSLNHSEILLVDMRFKGEDFSETNSQGWERSNRYYFKQLLETHPEIFSTANKLSIKSGESPIVDKTFIKHFPEYQAFEKEILIHHHIGGDGQAVAVPRSIHKGYGVIHTEENKIGIRKNAEEFSEQCASIAKNHTEMNGKTASDFKEYISNNKIDIANQLIENYSNYSYEATSYKMNKKKIKSIESSEKQFLSRRTSTRFSI